MVKERIMEEDIQVRGKPVDYVIQFNDVENGVEVGRLSIENGKLEFTGDLDESAQRLFEALKDSVDNYIRDVMTQ